MSCRQQRPWRSLSQALKPCREFFSGWFPWIHLCLWLISSAERPLGSGDPAASGEGELFSGPTVHWLNLKKPWAKGSPEESNYAHCSRAKPRIFLASLVPWHTTLYLWRQSWPLMFPLTWCWILFSGWIWPSPCSTCPQGFGAQRTQSEFFLTPFNVVFWLRSEAMHSIHKIV